ncbi:hypothetical protein TNCV_1267431 [Trichonephila clavipes]|nr:hypothetical protein TNCV_1267431 [Trichonephila clavipes]
MLLRMTRMVHPLSVSKVVELISCRERDNAQKRKCTRVEPREFSTLAPNVGPEGTSEEQRSNKIDSLPQNNLRRRSLSMEVLDGVPADRSE